MTDEYQKTTHGIRVSVESLFLDEKSDPGQNRYVWAYHVVIENRSNQTVQLLTRHWRITDAAGAVQEVRGDGVVGEQPVLVPGDSYEYTSGTPLGTPSGIMSGSYQMETEAGDRIDITVPAFSLDSPHEKPQIH
ncbi:MAG: Co2+/Mg2+ efflux protein ApaG [Rhodospirillales bacterium]